MELLFYRLYIWLNYKNAEPQGLEPQRRTVFDRETNLHDNWHRTYDSLTGRYTTADPLGLAGGDQSLYLYAKNNPLSFTDPRGENALAIALSVGVGVYAVGIANGWWSSPALASKPSSSNDPIENALGTSKSQPSSKPENCPPDEECEKKRKLEEGLCEGIAIQWGRQGVRICKTSAFTRYSECLRFGPGGVRTPLHGVDTPL